MNVKIKNFSVDMDVKTKGIEFEVRTSNGKAQIGDCYLTKTGLIWCRGKMNKENGIKITWQEFMDLLASKDSLKHAVKAVKKPSAN